ncbi:MAG: thiamine biosynthesis protein ThiS [Solirubrobacterales bacterium]|nr:thiamine biosynthesis protein ThiS [Solirubrobacterales bacterium]
MKVLVNGEERRVDDGATVAALLDALELAPGRRGVAVAVDAEVVPRSGWGERRLSDGSQVEVLTAIQGG